MVSQTSREAISGAEIYYLLTPSLTAPGKSTMGHDHFRDTFKLPITSFVPLVLHVVVQICTEFKLLIVYYLNY